MKKRMTFFSMLPVILLSMGMTCVAAQDMKTIYVGEERLRIAFPAGTYISKMQVEEENPYLEEQGVDKEHVEAYYEQNQIFAHCVDTDGAYEIVCSKKKSETQQYLEDLSTLEDSEVLSLAESVGNAYQEYGYQVTGIENYSSENEKFAVVIFETQGEEGTVWCKQYVTVRRNKTYFFTLRCFSKEAFEAQLPTMEKVVSGLLFYRIGPDSSVIYLNDTFGISYLVPKEWTSAETESENPTLQAQYFHDSKLGETFQFFAYDIWGNMDMLRQLTNTRGKLDTQTDKESVKDNTSFLESYFQDMNALNMESFGDAKLLFEDDARLVTHDDIQGAYYQKNYVMLKQGILYLFQYGYYEGSNLHESDIRQWLDSIVLCDAKLLDGDDAIYENIALVTKRCILAVAVGMGVLVILTGVYLYIHVLNKRKEAETTKNSENK